MFINEEYHTCIVVYENQVVCREPVLPLPPPRPKVYLRMIS